ncbi:MAG: glycosyltransferase [Accumulibacter sp.]|jgi:glycosyltransferase involved in cell wall biosynthesis|uniref:glycosyltransferase n=1 Tax=Accumulibacter sp. TaxID=2053492 RepID=UPI002FC389DF
MRILMVHNAYQQRGGEDSVVEAETELLRAHGHTVELYQKDNRDIADLSRLGLLTRTIWSRQTTADLQGILAQNRPDVIHVHNTFPLISPSLYWAAERAAIPVVQTLHNFRLFCPQAMFLRQETVCEDCLGRAPWRGITRACYRGSVAQSAVLAGMVMTHRALGTWRDKVTRYIALNEFCRRKFVEGGLPAERVVVKPNFVDFAPPPAGARSDFLFVGRLSAEKGIRTLVDAASKVPEVPVVVAGSGPEARLLAGAANIRGLGALPPAAVRERMVAAKALVLPSIWYENFPRTLVEAFGCGLPVIASRIGALAELIEDGVTGFLFEPGDADDLARRLRWAHAHPAEMARMGGAARAHYEAHFTADGNYQELMAIYSEAIAQAKGGMA